MKRVNGWYIFIVVCLGGLVGILFLQDITNNKVISALIGTAIALVAFSFVWKVINSVRGTDDDVPWGGGPN